MINSIDHYFDSESDISFEIERKDFRIFIRNRKGVELSVVSYGDKPPGFLKFVNMLHSEFEVAEVQWP